MGFDQLCVLWGVLVAVTVNVAAGDTVYEALGRQGDLSKNFLLGSNYITRRSKSKRGEHESRVSGDIRTRNFGRHFSVEISLFSVLQVA
ncbi:hypothetical protein JTE90_022813 [Oedothorax gibbosus]|uniref:Secreted protein n=1 Tax=Oedothorax gibbosus TaxID=931172 RepID=A0AAV6V855_9ARAC|nr:hypothetical protein JTE90_022813 [Oedothorax gibbosus]